LKGLSKKNKHLAQPILSKKEKKRAKEKEKLDRELLEAKGEESAKNRLKFATEITNILFAIYFRTLKGNKSLVHKFKRRVFNVSNTKS
jgi:hypothetical protein